ncbi:hypothetical protein CLOP_g21611 [Closterium sp. NIES-67]|nr:hypothetical protein CLOP_g21611 [Closterium sp. NIES-67]
MAAACAMGADTWPLPIGREGDSGPPAGAACAGNGSASLLLRIAISQPSLPHVLPSFSPQSTILIPNHIPSSIPGPATTPQLRALAFLPTLWLARAEPAFSSLGSIPAAVSGG